MRILLILTLMVFYYTAFTQQSIAGGDMHSIYLCGDRVVTTGNNVFGELGNGSNSSTRLVTIFPNGIVSVFAGETFSFFLKNDGTVMACGNNADGQLGDGTNINRNIPIPITSLTDVKYISARGDVGGTVSHTLFLKNDGTVWATGANNGCFGNGQYNYSNTPVQCSISDVISVAAGEGHSIFLKRDSTVWASGDNYSGALGDGSNADSNTPIPCSITNVVKIAAGKGYSLFLKSDGTVWACGSNDYGQLGDGTTVRKLYPTQVSGLTGITSIAAGEYHSLFLKNDGTVWACGLNFGALGDGTIANRSTPVQVTGISNIKEINAGSYFSLFRKNDETIWACGDDYRYSLGQNTDPESVTHYTPIEIADACSILPSSIHQEEGSNFKIFPNPFFETINIEPNIPYHLYDMIGHEIDKKNLSILPSGSYIVKTEFGSLLLVKTDK